MERTSDTIETLVAFIKGHRNNEANFEALHQQLLATEAGGITLPNLDAIKEKAAVYQKAKEGGGTAWPEFEKFATEFEKAVLEAKHNGTQ